MKKIATAVAGAIAAASLLVVGDGEDAAVTAAPGDRATAPTMQSRATPVDLERVGEIFGGADDRYVEFEETEQLAASSVTDAAVTGQVLGFEPGPKLYPDGGPNSGATVLMTVTIADVVDGVAPSPREVSVVLPASGEQRAEDVAEAMPAGTELVLYLAAAPDLPPGAPVGLMTPVSPQGFVVAAGEPAQDGVVYPLARKVVRNESLLDQLPAGHSRA